MLGSPKIRAGNFGGSTRKGSTRSATPYAKARLGFRESQPGDGAIKESKRASHYANPPGNPGLNGLQLDSNLNTRRGYVHNGVVGTSYEWSRKGEPL